MAAASFQVLRLMAAPATPDSAAIEASNSVPRDAIVLFDGRNLDSWLSQKDRHWEESDGPADWKILKDGSLEVVPGAGSLISKKRFSDFELHFEFRLAHDKTNGGVFLLARYELGIKNGGGKGPQYGCSFENLQKPRRPIAAALKPGSEWQVVDVTFRAPRVDASGKVVENARGTVLLNGVKIHDDCELGPRKGAAKRLGDSNSGPIMLQEHGSAYQFRNIWIVDRSKLADWAGSSSARQ
jgi:hypothetical protein